MRRLRTEDAAEYVGGLSPTTLVGYRHKGEGGPAFSRLGRIVVYSTDDLDRWVNERRVEGSTQRNSGPRPEASNVEAA